MPSIDLAVLRRSLAELPSEELVPSDQVDPYLFQTLIQPARRGASIHYGEIDFERFDDIDLRHAAGYCEELASMEGRLDALSHTVRKAEPCAVKRRAFC